MNSPTNIRQDGVVKIKGFMGVVFSKEILQPMIWSLSVLSTLFLLRLNQYGALLDTEVYKSAGEQIVNGQNPYTTGYRSGSLGALFIYLIAELGSIKVMEYIFGVFNVVGICLFVRVFTTSTTDKFLPIAALVLVWSSPVREMLLNHQITGICLGLFAVYKVGIKAQRNPIGSRALACVSLAIACDLKPQLIIPFLLVSVATSKKILVPLIAVALVLVSNLLLSTYTGVFLFREQLNVLLQLNTSNSNFRWRDISNLWPIIDFYVPAYEFWRIVAYLVSAILLILIPIITIKKSENAGKLISVAYPVFSIYCHTYDLIPLVAVGVISIFNFGINRVNLLIIFLILIPYKIFDLDNILFLALITILIYSSFESKKIIYTNAMKETLIAAFTYFGIGSILRLMTQNQQQINARIVCLVSLASFTAIIVNKKVQSINLTVNPKKPADTN